eukprot:15823_1
MPTCFRFYFILYQISFINMVNLWWLLLICSLSYHANAATPSRLPSISPTPLCLTIDVTVTDPQNIFNNETEYDVNDFNGLYTLSDKKQFDRPIYELRESSNDQNIQYYFNYQWIINGIGDDNILSYVTNNYLPPINDTIANWTHASLGGIFNVDIQCIDSYSPTTSPTNLATSYESNHDQYILIVNNSRVNFYQADDYCHRMYNTTLGTIISKEDLEEVIRLREDYISNGNINLTNSFYEYITQIWIGLKKSESGNFEWLDGTSCNYAPYHQSSNDRHFPFVEQQHKYNECGMIDHICCNTGTDYCSTWFTTRTCFTKYKLFVCNSPTYNRSYAEYVTKNTLPSPRRYIFVNKSKTRDDAEKYCNDIYSTMLATVINDADYYEVNQVRINRGYMDKTWIGSTCGDPMTYWLPGQSVGATCGCVIVTFPHFHQCQMEEWSCAETWPFICNAPDQYRLHT